MRLQRQQLLAVQHVESHAVGSALLGVGERGILAARGAENLDPTAFAQQRAGSRLSRESLMFD